MGHSSVPVRLCALSAAVTLATGLAMAVPSATAGAALKPSASSSKSALCSGVSASQVSSIVGRTVPAAKTTLQYSYFDKKLGIHEDETLCTYGTLTSASTLTGGVSLFYATLSKAPPQAEALAQIKAAIKKSYADLPKGTKATFNVSDQSGIDTLWAKISTALGSTSLVIEESVGWKGQKVAGALVESALPQSKVEALEKLAIGNFGV